METDRRRAANDFRARVFGTGAGRVIAFICECGRSTCHQTVVLDLDEYEQRRPGLILHGSHEQWAASTGDLFERAS